MLVLTETPAASGTPAAAGVDENVFSDPVGWVVSERVPPPFIQNLCFFYSVFSDGGPSTVAPAPQAVACQDGPKKICFSSLFYIIGILMSLCR